MKALVTGGAGFIGSHIVERLLKDGHSVVVLDNFYTGKEENLSFISLYSLPATRYSLIRGDIRDYSACLDASKDCGVIFHQAALRSVPKSMTKPHEYNEVNIDGTVNILEAAKEKGVKRVIFASSSSIYGDRDVFPEKESELPLLISPYALTKLAGEYYLRVYSENFGVETVSLRYFNVFGPRQALDDEYAVVIPKFIHCMLNDEQPPIFGTGKQSRDFTYIDNVVEANILAATVSLRHELSAISHEPVKHSVLNVANGKDTTVLGIVDELNKILNKSINPEFLPIRKGDVFKTLADISKIKKMLGFKGEIDFEEGLRRTVRWFEKEWKAIKR